VPVAPAPRRSKAAIFFAALFGALVGGALVAVALAWALGIVPGSRLLLKLPTEEVAPVEATTVTRTEQVITIDGDGSANKIAQVVAEKAVPSVVGITVVQDGTNLLSGRRFSQESGSGSGVIIREDGYIITNHHVVDGADRLIVTVGAEDKEAKVVGADKSTDLAVLKIDGTGYPAIKAGKASELVVGQWVMAVGSPFGFERTVTVGIVSALNRSEFMQSGNSLTAYTNLIQTDAAINPGNSGGALVNERGELVGINSLIQSPSGAIGAAQSSGVGFAIPSDFALGVAKQLIETGKATHPVMGVGTETIDKAAAKELGLPDGRGAVVLYVQPDSPASKAGIERGDIIVSIAGRKVAGVEDVFAAVRAKSVGDVVEVEAVRSKEHKTFEVTLGSDADGQ